jgi:hypothetical protein
MSSKIISLRWVLYFLLICLFVQTSKAEITWDSEHHVYSEGEETWVYMYNDASAEITGGIIEEFYMYNQTQADITGGDIGVLLGQDTSSVNVYAGSNVDLLRPNDSSTANVYGGTIDYLFALSSSTTNIHRGSWNEINARDLSTINFYVESYEWDPIGGEREGGLLTGIWLESTVSFSIDLVNEGTINHLNFVPEPTTLFLFGMGALLARAC